MIQAERALNATIMADTPNEGEETPETLREVIPEIPVEETEKEHNQVGYWKRQAEEAQKKLAEVSKTPKGNAANQGVPEPHTLTDREMQIVSLVREGFDEEELSELQALARGHSKPLSEVKSDPMFTTWLKSKREQGRAERATPPPASGNTTGWALSSTPGTTKVDGKTWKEIMDDPNLNRSQKNDYHGKFIVARRQAREGRVQI